MKQRCIIHLNSFLHHASRLRSEDYSALTHLVKRKNLAEGTSAFFVILLLLDFALLFGKSIKIGQKSRSLKTQQTAAPFCSAADKTSETKKATEITFAPDKGLCLLLNTSQRPTADAAT